MCGSARRRPRNSIDSEVLAEVLEVLDGLRVLGLSVLLALDSIEEVLGRGFHSAIAVFLSIFPPLAAPPQAVRLRLEARTMARMMFFYTEKPFSGE